MIRYQVITRVPDVDDPAAAQGNLCSAMEVWRVDGPGEFPAPPVRIDPLQTMMALRVPVFVLGEVLLVDGDGLGRKASKWDVTAEEFDDVDEAIARAREVQS